jgi:hypothetical protein
MLFGEAEVIIYDDVPLVGTGVIADVREDPQGPEEEARLSIGVISRSC